MKRIVSIFFAVVMTISLAVPSTDVSAASAKTKKNAMKAYREFLYDSDYLGFRLYDLNKDGIKELLVSCDGYGKNVYNIIVYTYKNKKVVRCHDDMEYVSSGLSYNKSMKRVMASRGGGGSIENWYYTLTKSKKIKKVYLQAIESGYDSKKDVMTYDYYYNGEKISKKKYNSTLKKWNKNTKQISFYKMSVKNIKKYIK